MKIGNFFRVDMFAIYGMTVNSTYINKDLMANFSFNLYQRAKQRYIKFTKYKLNQTILFLNRLEIFKIHSSQKDFELLIAIQMDIVF